MSATTEWARRMLDAADDAPEGDARDAILTRIGAVLLSTYAVWVDQDEIPTARRRSKERVDMDFEWIPRQPK